MWLSILVFFLMCWGFGFTATYWIRKKPENFFERHVMNLGIGLGCVPIVGVILNLARIILDWRIFLALAMILPIYHSFRLLKDGKRPKLDLKLHKSTVYFLIVLCIFVVFLSVYLVGSFKYPYLEDDDPWLYSIAIKYISQYGTYDIGSKFEGSNYFEPYPQGFNILTGILLPLNENIITHMKFFNSLIIALGILFFFYFVKEFTGSHKKALIAAFLFSVAPWYMGHFIWSQSLSLTLFFPAFYVLIKSKEQRGYFVSAALCISGVILSHELGGFIFGLMFGVYWFVTGIYSKGKLFSRFLNYALLAAILGVVLSGLFFIPSYGKLGNRSYQHYGDNKWYQLEAPTENHRVYNFADFFIAKTSSRIDTPIGLGIFFCILLFAFVPLIILNYDLLKKESWVVISLIWFVVTFIGLEGNALPFRIIPYRWGAFMVIPAVLIAAYSWNLLTSIKQLRKFGILLSFFLVIGLLLTSGYPKYKIQTSVWTPGGLWTSTQELQGYFSYLPSLPADTKIFPMCSNERKVIALDMFAEPWDPDYQAFKSRAFNSSPEEVSSWLLSRGYSYLVLDGVCVRKYGLNATNELISSFASSDLYTVVGSANGFILLKT
ncbi:TPA: hypothetical protein HA265_00095 [Candidatus Woesearchaeota archaeon]|nr:hypothetical protein [Candidatus Woesearchaeota archaeon]